jgi:hypothetical protein
MDEEVSTMRISIGDISGVFNGNMYGEKLRRIFLCLANLFDELTNKVLLKISPESSDDVTLFEEHELMDTMLGVSGVLNTEIPK